MKKRGEWMSNETGNVIVIIYLFLAGIFTLNFLPASISAHASGIAFLIASTYGVVAVHKHTPFFV